MRGQTVFQNVGWVEFYETHQFRRFMVGLAELDPPYKIPLGSRDFKHYRGYTLSADSSRPVSSPMKTPRTAT